MNPAAGLPPDQDARERARTVFDRPIALVAGAGTGKTAVLVARLLTWCLGPGWQRHAAARPGADAEAIAARVLGRVCAITFTEAAAAEMAARVAQALAVLRAGQEPIGLPRSALGLPQEELERRVDALRAAQDRVQVGTIHAFCRRLLARFPSESGLPPEFTVDADGTKTAAACGERVARELPLVLGGGAGASPDWVALAVEGVGPREVRAMLESLCAAGVGAQDVPEDPCDAGRVARTLHRLRTGIEGLWRLVADLASDGRVRKGSNARAAAAALGELRAEIGSATGAEQIHAAAARHAPAIAKAAKAWCAGEFNAGECAVLGERVAAVSAAAGPLLAQILHLAEMEPDLLRRICRVVRPLLADVQAGLRTRGVLGFADLLAGARDLLRDRRVLAAVRADLDLLMVDEFQDTDAVQCGILAELALADLPGAPPPSLFVVGDPKQSIYAWRNADLAAYEEFLAAAQARGGSEEALDCNFRSVAPILEEVSRVVGAVMLPEPGLQPRFQPLRVAPRNVGRAGFTAGGRASVEYWLSWQRRRDGGLDTSARAARAVEARAIAADIAELHRAHGVELGTCAILLRTFGYVEEYLGALRERGIRYAIERDQLYYQRREVLDALALLRCVVDPADRLALVAWLRSPAVGVPDAALAGLLSAGDSGLDPAAPAFADALAAAQEGAAAAQVPAALRQHLGAAIRHALRTVHALRAAYLADPPDRFVARLRTGTLHEGSEAARFLGTFRAANLERFHGLLLAALRSAEGDGRALLRTLEDALAHAAGDADAAGEQEADPGAVRVLTVHRAKGLEFAHVYLANLHGGRKRDSGRAEDGAAIARVGGQVEFALRGHGSLDWDLAKAARVARDEAEAVRVLYVAMTRAGQRLVMAGALGASASAESLAHLVERGIQPPLPLQELHALVQVPERAEAARAEFTSARAMALWRLPGLEPERREERAPLPAVALPALARLEQEYAALRAARLQARQHQARRRLEPVSAVAGRQARPVGAAARGGGDAALAQAVGTAFHRLVERTPLAQLASGALPADATALSACVPEDVAAADRDAVVRGVQRIVAGLAGGRVLARMRALCGGIVAREVPFLLARDPVPVSGRIDLLARDPAGGLVVVDYKTDRVEDDVALARAAAGHAAQARIYVDAVRAALGSAEPVCCELWFVAADRVVPLAAP